VMRGQMTIEFVLLTLVLVALSSYLFNAEVNVFAGTADVGTLTAARYVLDYVEKAVDAAASLLGPSGPAGGDNVVVFKVYPPSKIGSAPYKVVIQDLGSGTFRIQVLLGGRWGYTVGQSTVVSTGDPNLVLIDGNAYLSTGAVVPVTEVTWDSTSGTPLVIGLAYRGTAT